MKAKKWDKDSYRIPKHHCPVCGYEMDASTVIGSKSRAPKAGDFSLCLQCGEIAIFEKDGSQRMAGVNDMMNLDPKTSALLTRGQNLIRATRPMTWKI